jgi:coenzyme F420 biosynthesis associated uncharacterized protein
VAPTASLVDWGLAERVAVGLAGQPAPAHTGALLRLRHDIAEIAPLAERLVGEATALHPPSPAVVEVVDRPTWVRANIQGMRGMLTPLLERWDERTKVRGFAATVTSRITAVELGTLLGWMSGKVLGQYDLLLGRADAGVDGTVYIVGPNIIGLEDRHQFPRREFRLWVTLHELTHRAQFEGVPWMRDHFLGLADRTLQIAEPDPSRLADAARTLLQDRSAARRRLDEGGLAALVATPEQLEALHAVGGLMALLEGHGDVIMDRAGRDHVGSAARFGEVLRARRAAVNPGVRFLRRLIGLEAKLAQYQLGEQFLAEVESVAGPAAVERCWQHPDNLPTLDEIRQPARWLDRLGLSTAPV